MDFDPKCFFENPPRMKEDLKDYIKKLSENIILKIISFCKNLFPNERLFSKHIKLAILAISPDPVTIYNRNGLCIQNVKLKPIGKILCKTIDNAINNLNENKYGNLDKKIFKSCAKVLKNTEIKLNSTATVAIAAAISQVCGILMQSSVENEKDLKTLNIDIVKENGMKHKTTNGTIIPYSSLIRFINVIENFEVREIVSNKKNITKESKRKLESIEIKPKVTFESKRPSTPTDCFWED